MSNMFWLKLPIERLRGVGYLYAKKLHKLGIFSIEDLLFHFPSRYEDFSNIKKIKDIKINEICSTKGTIKEISISRTWKKRMFIVEAIIEDETGAIRAVWFNQPFLKKTFSKGKLISISGKVVKDEYGTYFSNPEYEIIDKSKLEGHYRLKHTAGIVPIYPETEGISSKILRHLIQTILPKIKQIPDIIPKEIRKKLNLMEFGEAIVQIHFPDSYEKLSRAKKRFAFEEIFLLQLVLQYQRLININSQKAPQINLNIDIIKKFLNTLPFQLTYAQKRAAWEILKDMTRPIPMNRLLNGDVGSGKTIVAMIAAMQVLENNWQVAMLAPTEILAKQHFQKISKFFSPFNFKIALLTASESKISQEGIFAKISKKLLQEKISGGAPLMVIGTHAILQKNIQFGKLALVIVDEQHRFGIAQRASLLKKDSNQLIPHLLSMSATPIPRTLALGLYGDLDISILDELPQGRKKIITKVVLPKERNRVYEFVREEIKGGRQVFVICPRIDPSKHKIEKENDFFQESEDPKVEIKAVKSEFKKLSKDIFPEAKVSMLHGKMKPYEKELIMRSFLDRKIDILVSTSVVEVGIDVPNATIIIIEGAEHFGLSQIHQFRGRVGRGEYQSYCFLFVESYSKNVRERLNAIVESENGFELAQKDLQIRGPGQFFGNRQWGLPDLAMQALSNIELVQIAREEAIYFLKRDPNLNTAPMLKHRIEELRKKIHIE